MTTKAEQPSAGAIRAAETLFSGGWMKVPKREWPECQGEVAEIISRETHDTELLEALKQLRTSTLGYIWEPMGNTGDASDWFQCQMCGAKSRDTRSLLHRNDCPMEIAQAAIKKAEEGS